MEGYLPFTTNYVYLAEEGWSVCLQAAARRSANILIHIVNGRSRLNFDEDRIDWWACREYQDVGVIYFHSLLV